MLASRPDVVLYQAGADAFEGDRLGHLALTKGGLKRRDELLFGACRRAFVPVAITLGGGYADSVDDIVDIHYQTIKSANEANISRSL